MAKANSQSDYKSKNEKKYDAYYYEKGPATAAKIALVW
jgi:hypothetical protein